MFIISNPIQNPETVPSSKQLVDDRLDVNLRSVEKLEIRASGIPQQKWKFCSRQDHSLRAFFDFHATRDPEQLRTGRRQEFAVQKFIKVLL